MIINSIFGLILIAAVAGAQPAPKTVEGIVIEELSESSIMGNKKTSYRRSYYTKTDAVIIDSNVPYKLLFKLQEKKIYLINELFRDYMVMTFDDFKRLSKNTMDTLNNQEYRVEKTGKKRTINKFTCREFVILVPKLDLQTVVWVSEKMDVKLEPVFLFAEQTRFINIVDKILVIMKNQNGYILESETHSKHSKEKISIHQKVYRVERETFLDGMFAKPVGYEEKPFNKK